MPGYEAMRDVDTPLGPMRLAARGGALAGAWFTDQRDAPPMAGGGAIEASPRGFADASGAGAPARPSDALDSSDADRPADADRSADAAVQACDEAVLNEAARQLAAWFRSERKDFDLPMAPQGTPFQMAVWRALCELPFGATISYGELARRVGRPGSARAVAQAVGRNPISIVIPCHRIVGHDTSLTGFGGGLPRKHALLAHEGHVYRGGAARSRSVHPGQGRLEL